MGVIVISAAAVSALLLPGCSRKESSKAMTLTAGNFEAEVLHSKKPVLVDFWAEWCGPCMMMDPVIKELAAECYGKAVVGKVNVDDHPAISKKYGITEIPTFLVFKDGELTRTIVGTKSKDYLKNVLQVLQ